MGIENMYISVLKAEKDRFSKNASFSKKLQKIDELRASGLLHKKGYRFPMRDTLGRNISSPPKPAVAKQQFPDTS